MFTLPHSGVADACSPVLRKITCALRPIVDATGQPIPLGPRLASADDAAALLAKVLGHEAVEVFGVLCLTARSQVIGWAEVSRGRLNRVGVHPRDVFMPALLFNAARIIAAHCHPSGDPTPSGEDVLYTSRLMAMGRKLGVECIDHLIIGHEAFVSLRCHHSCRNAMSGSVGLRP